MIAQAGPTRAPVALERAVLLKRFEHLALLAAALVLYLNGGGSLLLLVGLLMAPDLSLLALLLGPRGGSIAYALCHFQVWPVALATYGLLAGDATLVRVGLAWFGHIHMDRALGLDLFPPAKAEARRAAPSPVIP